MREATFKKKKKKKKNPGMAQPFPYGAFKKKIKELFS